MPTKNNAQVQAPNTILNTKVRSIHDHSSTASLADLILLKFICNIRRSPTMSETFAFDVAFDTTFEQVEMLRDKMLAFVKSESRDYVPSFDVVVVGMCHI